MGEQDAVEDRHGPGIGLAACKAGNRLSRRRPHLASLPSPDTPGPDAIEIIADTDKLMTMCSCSASSDVPY